jgi:arsenite-transporting ATPase
VRLFDREMIGIAMLEAMGGEVYGGRDATDILHRDEPIRIRKRGATYVLSMRLPFVERTDLDVFRKGEELYVRVGPYKRNLILPQILQRLDVREASFVEDRLEVLFGREPRQAAGSTA